MERGVDRRGEGGVGWEGGGVRRGRGVAEGGKGRERGGEGGDVGGGGEERGEGEDIFVSNFIISTIIIRILSRNIGLRIYLESFARALIFSNSGIYYAI